MKKAYDKPAVVLAREIEALAGTCNTGDGDTGGVDKETSPAEGTCVAPQT